MISSAPSSRRMPASAAVAVAITLARAAASRGTTAVPTPPVAPATRTDSPGDTSAVASSARAVRPVVASAAASSADRPGGRCASSGVSASKTAYSASEPVLNEGRVAPAIPRSARGIAWPKISSPTWYAVTSGPTALTVPAKSLPGTCGNGNDTTSRNSPPGNRTSAGLTDAAAIRTWSCPGPGRGTGRSATVYRSGGPYSVTTTACTVPPETDRLVRLWRRG
jgi:hypothetical protein